MAAQPTPKTITATEASNNFGRMADEAARGRSLFIVTRMGNPHAVVIGFDQYRALLEELETVQELKRLCRGNQGRVRRALGAPADPYRGRRLKAAETSPFR